MTWLGTLQLWDYVELSHHYYLCYCELESQNGISPCNEIRILVKTHTAWDFSERKTWERQDSGKEKQRRKGAKKKETKPVCCGPTSGRRGCYCHFGNTDTHIAAITTVGKKCFSETCNYYRLQIGPRSITGARQNKIEMLCTIPCAHMYVSVCGCHISCSL